MSRIIDLSHRLTPGTQRFKLEVKSFSVEEYIPGYPVAKGEWYVMNEIEMSTHVGTHVEAPLHAIKDGTQAVDLDCRRFIGPAAVIDFTDKGFNDPISRAEIKSRGAHIQKDDIVLIKTGLSKFFGTLEYKRPYIETEAIDWLIEQEIKCLGVDCSGIENKTINSMQVNHKKLFSRSIPLIEDMNNLDRLQSPRVFFIAFVLPIEGLDASMLRPVAIEPLDEELKRIFLGPKVTWEGFTD